MEEPEYASEMSSATERYLSLAFVVLWMILAYRYGRHSPRDNEHTRLYFMGMTISAVGIKSALATGVLYLIPLACIWFPDVMSKLDSVTPDRWFQPRTIAPRGVLRWVSWFLLVGLPLIIYSFSSGK